MGHVQQKRPHLAKLILPRAAVMAELRFRSSPNRQVIYPHFSIECLYFLFFEGTRQSNHAFEMLYLKRLTNSKACDRQLRRAILLNSLVNLHRHWNTWQEVDRGFEYLDLELNRELWGRQTSTFGLDVLFTSRTLMF